MNRLAVLGLCLGAAACAPQSQATAPEPVASFNGTFVGTATLGVSGVSSYETTNPICVNQRPLNMKVENGYATLWYHNWRMEVLHYRGPVDSFGKVELAHLNDDGSLADLRLQISGDNVTGNLLRGRCNYTVAMSRI